MAHAFVGHEGHTLLDGLFGSRAYDAPFHDVSDQGRRRCLAFQYDVARIVPLRDDADELLAIHHDERANVILGHFCDRIEHGDARMNGTNGPGLLAEQLSYGSHFDSFL